MCQNPFCIWNFCNGGSDVKVSLREGKNYATNEGSNKRQWRKNPREECGGKNWGT